MSLPTLGQVVVAVNFYQQITLRTDTRDHIHPRFADSILMDMTGCTEDEADRALEIAIDEGFVECGVSARTGWLTNLGRRMLVNNPANTVPSGLTESVSEE